MISNLNEIRQIPIAEVIHKWSPVKKNFACCPIHGEKSASLHVNTRKNFFKCFGCGAGGDAIKFVQLVERCDFIEAAEIVAQFGGITVEFDDADKEAWKAKKEKQFASSQAIEWALSKFSMFLEQSEEAKQYLQKRGIEKDTAEAFMLGFAPDDWSYLSGMITGDKDPKPFVDLGLISERETGGFYDRFRNRLIFPYFNEQGQYVSLSGRTVGNVSEKNPKALKGNNSELYSNDSFLFGLYQALPAIKQQRFVCIVEGEMDVLQMHQAGVENTVGSGNNRIKENQCKLLKRYTNKVVLIPDNDSSKQRNTGFDSVIDNLRILIKHGFQVEIFELPEDQDPDSYCLSIKTSKNDPGTEITDILTEREEDARSTEDVLQQSEPELLE